jgi:hypothetical protein
MSLEKKIDELAAFSKRSGYLQALQDIKSHLTNETNTLENLYKASKMSAEDINVTKIKLEIYFDLIKFLIKLVEVKETNLN